jgi:hypothetical protein
MMRSTVPKLASARPVPNDVRPPQSARQFRSSGISIQLILADCADHAALPPADRSCQIACETAFEKMPKSRAYCEKTPT